MCENQALCQLSTCTDGRSGRLCRRFKQCNLVSAIRRVRSASSSVFSAHSSKSRETPSTSRTPASLQPSSWPSYADRARLTRRAQRKVSAGFRNPRTFMQGSVGRFPYSETRQFENDEDAADVEPGIAAALAHDGPVLIDAVVSRQELSIPPRSPSRWPRVLRCTWSRPS
jgi:hypothetical protein